MITNSCPWDSEKDRAMGNGVSREMFFVDPPNIISP